MLLRHFEFVGLSAGRPSQFLGDERLVLAAQNICLYEQESPVPKWESCECLLTNHFIYLISKDQACIRFSLSCADACELQVLATILLCCRKGPGQEAIKSASSWLRCALLLLYIG